MSRLIDTDELLGRVERAIKNSNRDRGYLILGSFVREMLANCPTIDAEPVRHGHWIIHVDELFPADSTQECSFCHGEEWLGIKHENYCPNCGAKMLGGSNEE